MFQGVPELPAVVGLTIGEVEFSGHLPPVVMVPEGGADGLEIHLAELVLNVTPMGGEGSDVYSLYIRIPVTAVADGGYVGLNAAEAVTVHASLIGQARGTRSEPNRLQHSSRARCGPRRESSTRAFDTEFKTLLWVLMCSERSPAP